MVRNRGAETAGRGIKKEDDLLAGLAFVGIHHLDVPLGGGDALVGHDALDGADVGARCRLQRRKGATIRVEGDVLRNACRTDPLLHRDLRPAVHQPLEDQFPLLEAVADQLERSITNGDDVLGLVLLRDDVHTRPPAE